MGVWAIFAQPGPYHDAIALDVAPSLAIHRPSQIIELLSAVLELSSFLDVRDVDVVEISGGEAVSGGTFGHDSLHQVYYDILS